VRHGSAPSPNAASSASRTVRANTNCIRARTSFGTSCSTSLRFAQGTITLFAPARCAPSTFSLTPPTGETRPRSVIWDQTLNIELPCGGSQTHAPRQSLPYWAGRTFPSGAIRLLDHLANTTFQWGLPGCPSWGRTSPSEPVSLRCPLPGVTILSAGMISPSPIPVTTRPHDSPPRLALTVLAVVTRQP
jgi:hypothetical protein